MYTRRKSVLKKTSAIWWSRYPASDRKKYWPPTNAMRKAPKRPAFQSQTFRVSRNTRGTMSAPSIGGTHSAAAMISGLVEAPATRQKVEHIQTNIGPHGTVCPVGKRVIASNQL